MTKAELIEEVARASDLTRKHSEVIVDCVFSAISDALKQGDKIELRGFGSFHPGGCMVALADGSVHFLSEHMDIHAYRALATRADGLPVGGWQP